MLYSKSSKFGLNVIASLTRCCFKTANYPNLQRTKRESEISLSLKIFLGIPMVKKVDIEYMDQFGYWKHYQTMHHEQNARRTAQNRAKSTGKRHRLMCEN